jgi:hypothetical protein
MFAESMDWNIFFFSDFIKIDVVFEEPGIILLPSVGTRESLLYEYRHKVQLELDSCFIPIIYNSYIAFSINFS